MAKSQRPKPRPPSGARSRRKGHSFERWVANALREVFPNAKRQLEYQIDSCQGIDIANTDPFKIQCKKLKAYVSINTIDEVVCDPELGDVAVLVTAADGKRPMVVLDFSDWLELVRGSHGR